MKKNKIIAVLSFICVLFTLTSCSQTIGINYVETEDTTYSKIENDVTQVFDTVSSGCVGIYASNKTSAGTGSGVVYKEENGTYYVITNAHVVEDMTSYKITLGGVKYYNATLVGSDSTNDIAVLTFNLDILDGDVSIYINSISETTDILVKGQTVIAIGCPLGLENFNTVNTGVISLLTTEVVQHDAPINPGNSGGGLFNLAGRLIGINSSKEVYTTGSVNGVSQQIPVEGINYAISMAVVRNCVKTIEAKGGAIVRPVLGVTVASVNLYLDSNSAYKSFLPNGVEFGIVVKVVTENSNAEAAGISIGDCLLTVDGIQITNLSIISEILHQKTIGDKLSLYLYRSTDKNYHTIEVTLLAKN